MNKRIRKKSKESAIYYNDLYTAYMNKYYNLFLNSLSIPELDVKTKNYILRQVWAVGSVAASIVKNLDDMIIFTPFAVQLYDIYDYPKTVTLINTRGVSFITNKTLEVDKDVVLCYIQNNQKPIKWLVDNYVNRIVAVEMVIRTNLAAHKCPFLIGTTSADKEKMEDLIDRILGDELALYLDVDEINLLKTLNTATPYIIDKLYQYRNCLENELLTYLGIDNNPIEKGERLLVDEVNANNALINLSGQGYLENLKDFFAKIKDLFGITLTVESKVELSNSVHEDKEQSSDEEDNSNDTME